MKTKIICFTLAITASDLQGCWVSDRDLLLFSRQPTYWSFVTTTATTARPTFTVETKQTTLLTTTKQPTQTTLFTTKGATHVRLMELTTGSPILRLGRCLLGGIVFVETTKRYASSDLITQIFFL